MGAEKKVISIRLDEEFITELKKYAEKENRPLSNFIETVLKSYIGDESMKRMQFDSLGRVQLPVSVVEKLELQRGSALCIQIEEHSARLILHSTDEIVEAEITDKQRTRLPSDWKYIRQLGENNQIVLPKSMRDLLNWTQETNLKITCDTQTIFIEKE